MSHTPGPWAVDETGVFVWAPECHDHGDLVCNMPEGDAEHSLKRWPANARLIAAAPDLLAALSEIATSDFPMNPTAQVLVAKARAALKALKS